MGVTVQNPKFVMFTGPMFGSKTTRLLAVVDRFRYQNRKVIAFKPLMDDRYSDVEIRTHSGGSLPAVGVQNSQDVVKYLDALSDEYDVIVVDEAFMIDGIAGVLLELFRKGKTIVISSLQLSASGNVFEEIQGMLPWATKIEICAAVCPVCGRDAHYTHRKVEGLAEIAVGGAEMYEPRCWEHHSFMNQKGLES
ncbi:MAG: thymidine kinase [Flammeovirgaceae bacterium]|nr:thymidine kinase [Flammeovirgaceae bacterium]|tara:strand:+ start:1529 stop:2110 length:582 start_codon:yes stop_codon:yes gene_type:complete